MVARSLLIGHFCCNRQTLTGGMGPLLPGKIGIARKGHAQQGIFKTPPHVGENYDYRFF
jgi:hypothetical protein